MRDNRLPGVILGVSPCTDCSERHTACHDNCPKYHEWKAELQKVKEAKKAYEQEKEDWYKEWNRRNKWRRKTF